MPKPLNIKFLPSYNQQFEHGLQTTSACSYPFNSLFIRYNMQRQEEPSQPQQDEDLQSEHHSSNEDLSEDGKIEELLTSDQKIQELHRSVQRLREFVAALSTPNAHTFPLCVEQYCDKIGQYRLKEGCSVIQLAERRVNKMLRNRKIKRNWNKEDITLLVWLVSKQIEILNLSHFSQLQKNNWEFISTLIAGSTWQKCKFRWLSLKKVKLVTHKWSKIQSKILTEAVAQDDKINWKLVSEKLYEKNPSKSKVFRTAKQCRQHWNCFLNPNIHKGPWSIQEDKKLLQYVLQLQGSKKWSQISKFMQGRTENALKNRFNLLVNTQRKLSGQLTQKRLLKICLNRLMLEQGQQQQGYQLQSPILSQPNERSPELLDADENRDPIIPTVTSVTQQTTVPVNLGFQPTRYGDMVGFLNNGYCNQIISSPQMLNQNTVYFSFLFPGQFL